MAKLKVRAFEPVFSSDDVQVHRMVLAPEEEVPWHFHTHLRDTLYVLADGVERVTGRPATTVREFVSLHAEDFTRP